MEANFEVKSLSTSANMDEGLQFIEQFNQEMMGQFLSHQRKVQSSFQKWEIERQRQHEVAMAKWREEARSHEKEMFGMFVKVTGMFFLSVSRFEAEILKKKKWQVQLHDFF